MNLTLFDIALINGALLILTAAAIKNNSHSLAASITELRERLDLYAKQISGSGRGEETTLGDGEKRMGDSQDSRG